MDKVSKIELDQIKQGCSCVFHHGRSTKYKVSECKQCLHKQGKSFIKKQIDDRNKKLEEHLEEMEHRHKLNELIFGQLMQPEEKPKQVKLNWFQKLIYM